jgi:hypothetical protein
MTNEAAVNDMPLDDLTLYKPLSFYRMEKAYENAICMSRGEEN